MCSSLTLSDGHSPVLKASLKGLRGDLLVAPADEAEVVAAAGLAAQHGVPVTPRGAGTGNYGQAVPLQGGAVLDLSRLDRVHALDAEHGTARAGAGVLLADLEEAAREHGWELRQHPSTRRTATLGGFVAGGSTGVGGLLHGGTAEDGAVLAARVVTMEPEPRVLELEGRDVFPVVHAYGTNGILTEVTVPLARAHKWQDAVCAFDSLADAAGFALAAGRAPALIARAVSAFQAPIGAEFFHTMTQLREEQRDKHLVLVQCTKPSLGPLARLASDWEGAVGYVESAEEAKIPLYEYCWNHTTLLGLKKDKAVTYLQAAMEPDRALALVAEVEGAFRAEEVMQHLEAVRFGGQVGFASLALLRPGSNARLQEIMDWHEAHGMPVFDPHTHVLEDGGMKEIDWAQYHFKKEADPQGLLNPGKMRAWDEADAIKSNSATDQQQGAFTAAYRVADTSELKAEATARGGGVPRRRYWSHWTTQEMSAADLTQAVALLPIGAVEAHGPVLPLGTDAIHNKAILDRAVAALPDDVEVLVLPAQVREAPPFAAPDSTPPPLPFAAGLVRGLTEPNPRLVLGCLYVRGARAFRRHPVAVKRDGEQGVGGGGRLRCGRGRPQTGVVQLARGQPGPGRGRGEAASGQARPRVRARFQPRSRHVRRGDVPRGGAQVRYPRRGAGDKRHAARRAGPGAHGRRRKLQLGRSGA